MFIYLLVLRCDSIMLEQINDAGEYDGGAVLVATTMSYCV